MELGPDRTVIIRQTRHGWSGFSSDNTTGVYGEDNLIASSDHAGALVEYILTLEPGEIIIQPGEPSTAEWFAASREAGCTGTSFDVKDDTIAHEGELPCPLHPGL